MPGFSIPHNQRGAALLVVLVMVVVLGLAAGIAGTTWKTVVQREKEKELLFRGDQYRKAIESYYTMAHAGAQGQYPRRLEDLLRDPRSVETLRHIRKLYKDPMTGEDWVLIREGAKIEGATGEVGIIGVRSSSDLEPFKKDGFSEENEDFKDADKYSEWEFVFRPSAPAPAAKPAGQPGEEPAAQAGGKPPNQAGEKPPESPGQ